jgi:hypothetical protein
MDEEQLIERLMANSAGLVTQTYVLRMSQRYKPNGSEQGTSKNEQRHVEVNYQSRYIDQGRDEWRR